MNGTIGIVALALTALLGLSAAPAAGEPDGKALYDKKCAMCHGKDAVARYGGSVPDLRYSDAEAHGAWPAIVIGGSKSASGMPAQQLTLAQSELVRKYVLSLAAEIR